MKANLGANLLRVADLREGMVVDYYDCLTWYEYTTFAREKLREKRDAQPSDHQLRHKVAEGNNLFVRRYFLVKFLLFQEENEISFPGYFWQVVRLSTESSQQSKFSVTKAKFANKNVFEMVVNHEPNSPTNIG